MRVTGSGGYFASKPFYGPVLCARGSWCLKAGTSIWPNDSTLEATMNSESKPIRFRLAYDML